MFESSLLLLDRLIALVKNRRDNERNFWKEIIEPLFLEAQTAFEDYVKFLKEVQHIVLSDNLLTEDQRQQLRTHRNEHALLREKIRQLANVYYSNTDDSKLKDLMMNLSGLFDMPDDQFILLPPAISGISAADQEMLKSYKDSRLWEVRFRGTAPRSIIEILEHSGRIGKQPDYSRLVVAKIVELNLASAERYWPALLRNYAALKLEYLKPS